MNDFIDISEFIYISETKWFYLYEWSKKKKKKNMDNRFQITLDCDFFRVIPSIAGCFELE